MIAARFVLPLLLLSSTSSVCAQVAVGADALASALSNVMNGPAGLRGLDDLRGAVILVEFWATWCGPCRAEVPHIQRLHDAFADRGLVVVAISDEGPEKVAPFVAAQGMTYPVASSRGAMTVWGVKGIPHAFLVGPDGKIAWNGHPSALKDETIEPLLASAISPLQRLTEQLAPVQDLLDRSQRGKALAMLELLDKGGKLEPAVHDRAVVAKRWLDRAIAALVERAGAEGAFAQAMAWRELADEWQGRPEAARAVEALAELEKSSPVDVRAAEGALRAQRLVKQGDLDAAAAAWQEVVATGSKSGVEMAEKGLAAIEGRRAALAERGR